LISPNKISAVPSIVFRHTLPENPSATTRTLTAEKYKNFSLSFDLEPKSAENTMMIYFGYQNESKYNSIEINSYQSNLIFNGESITGKGSILKDGNYNIRLTCINGRITLYCNSEVIFDKSGFDLFSEGCKGYHSDKVCYSCHYGDVNYYTHNPSSSSTGNKAAQTIAAMTALIITENPLLINGKRYLSITLTVAEMITATRTALLFFATGMHIAINIP
jgi:hypothetical protein